MKEGKEDQDYHFVLFFKWFSTIKLSSNFLSAFFPPSQAGAGLRLAGLCLWTDPSGGVHVALHVPIRVGGSLRSFPPVVTDPVRESQPPQVVQCPLCLHLPALPILCSGIPAYLHRSDQQSATCFPLHRHHGTGPWPDCYKYLSLFKKTCSIYFWISVRASLYSSHLRCAWWWKPTPSSGRMYRGSWPGLKTKQVCTFILSSVLTTSRWIPCFHFLPRVPKADDDQSVLSSAGPSPVLPQVSQYLYFLFAPTLIYRDKYPRYKHALSVVETGRS